MKVQVNIEYPSGHQCHSETKLTLDVKPFDSVASLKQRLALVEPIPFQQELILGDEALADQQKFGDLDLKEGQQFRLQVRATEDMFGEQLAKLLQVRPLSVSELGLLYCHQHGATAIQALEILGSQEELGDYVGRSKRFAVEKSGLVGLAQKTTAPQRLDCISEAQEEEPATSLVVQMHLTVRAEGREGCAEEATVSLKATSTDTPRSLCQRALEAECIPFEPEDVVFQGRALKLEDSLQQCKIGDGSQLHVTLVATPEHLLKQLAGVLKPRKALSVTELSDHYCYKFGTPVFRSLRLLGLKGQLKEFLKSHPDRFSLEAGCVSLR
eukprot:TRINITY_DN77539_c0_g1_i1.p1 TRINITY_DN77539_c0_g1~~TRINITY_DN77539_c0_g1_i1.p1  ORF type:complete len:326 (+),score=81.38 TRINITY_DN77539_c0_g1_i1:164-1141(+)